MTDLDHDTARSYWRALVDNASLLVTDAQRLLDASSVGRARALTVLAEEELGKAYTVYEVYSAGWSAGDTGTRDLPDKAARDHLAKYMTAFRFGRELDHFWGEGEYLPGVDYPADDEDRDAWLARRDADARAAAQSANQQKQRGFYVDLTPGGIKTPDDLDATEVAEDLRRAAQVIEMMLIKDHSRMKFDSPDRYDDTHAQQQRLLPISHPEEFAEFLERVREAEQSDVPPGDDA